MTRLRLAATAFAALALVVLPMGSVAGGAATAQTTGAATSTLNDAKSVSMDARALRAEVALLLGEYLTTYGDRLDANQAAQLTSYKASADRQLAVVVVTAHRLRSMIAEGGSPSQIKAAVLAAQTAQKRAKATAQSSFDRARVIVEPKLSLFEGLLALSDYNRMMDRFDALADRTAAIARAYRSR